MTNRRSFIQTSAGLSALAFGHVNSLPAATTTDRISLGFIGVGKMGRGHLKKFLSNDGVQVVAVCDVVKERREDAANLVTQQYAKQAKSGTFSGVRGFNDFRELLQLDGIDAVVIATPDHWHTIPCRLAAQAGKHIYCEKPLTHNIAEGRQLVSDVSQAGVIFQTGKSTTERIWWSFPPSRRSHLEWSHRPSETCAGLASAIPLYHVTYRPRRYLQAPIGILGSAPHRYGATTRYSVPKGIHDHFPHWRLQELAGGGLADMGAHHFDIAQWALKMDTLGPSQNHSPNRLASSEGFAVCLR